VQDSSPQDSAFIEGSLLPAMKHVMIVEDDENERFTLTRVLERAGFTVTPLSCGDNALASIEAASCEAVITDLMMPGIDGVTLARSVAARFPDLPIVLTSAFPMCRAQLDRLGISGMHFLSKPLDLDRLLALLGAPRLSTSAVPVAVGANRALA
jgi:DNA-binding NtrC family response regulator